MKKNILLLLVVVALTVAPFVIHKDAKFGGADGKAEKVITEIQPDYKPWFSSVWDPPSGEVESLLFALQAAAGAGFIGYYIGYARGKKSGAEKAKC